MTFCLISKDVFIFPKCIPEELEISVGIFNESVSHISKNTIIVPYCIKNVDQYKI